MSTLLKFKASVKGIKTKATYRKDKPVHLDFSEVTDDNTIAHVIKNRMGYSDVPIRLMTVTNTGFNVDLANDMRILCERC